jgi:hypothetical protein
MTINGTSGLVFNDASTQNTAATGFGFKNRIINGAMMIDQRNAGASVANTAGNVYTLDRWQANGDQASKFTTQQDAGAVTPPVGFVDYLGITSSSAYSVTSSEVFQIRTKIEGFNIADLAWGTANAQTITLSFWVRSSLTGTFGGSLQNSAGNRSYPFSYTISAANTWEQKAITITGDTTGTWLTNNGIGIRLQYGLGVGSTYSGTAGSWSGSDFVSSTGATSVVGTNGATFYITGVQLEKGSTATSFDYRPYGTELALCQRYYESNFPIGVAPAIGYSQNPSDVGSISYNGSSTRSSVCWYKVTKRASATVTLYSPAGYGNTNSNTFNIYVGGSWYNYNGTPQQNGAYFYLDGTAAGGSLTTGNAYLTSGNWSASAEL